MAIRYRVIDTRTGKVRGLFSTFKTAHRFADKMESGGKYVMVIESIRRLKRVM